MPRSRSVLPIAHAFFTCVRKRCAIVVASHRRAAACWRPHRRDERSDDEAARADAIGKPLQRVAIGIDVDVRIEQKQIDAVELHAVDVGRGRQVEHRVQIDRRLRVGPFADEPRPHRVVKCGFRVCSHKKNSLRLCASASGQHRIGLRVSRAEVFQDDERLGFAQILDAHAAGCGVGRDEQLVLRHFAEPDHRRRRT